MLGSLILSLVVATVLIQVAVFGTTIYLHRTATHRALTLHPAVAWIFRFSLWLTTGLSTKEWVAVHRKHHAFADQAKRRRRQIKSRHHARFARRHAGRGQRVGSQRRLAGQVSRQAEVFLEGCRDGAVYQQAWELGGQAGRGHLWPHQAAADVRAPPVQGKPARARRMAAAMRA